VLKNVPTLLHALWRIISLLQHTLHLAFPRFCVHIQWHVIGQGQAPIVGGTYCAEQPAVFHPHQGCWGPAVRLQHQHLHQQHQRLPCCIHQWWIQHGRRWKRRTCSDEARPAAGAMAPRGVPALRRLPHDGDHSKHTRVTPLSVIVCTHRSCDTASKSPPRRRTAQRHCHCSQCQCLSLVPCH